MHSRTLLRKMQVKMHLVTAFSCIAIGNCSMHSGKCCWMTYSLKHTNMGLLANASMGLIVDFILRYLHIQLTTLKSE